MRRSSRVESDDDLQGLGYYTNTGISRRKWKNGLVVGVLTIVWYLCAVVTITTTKEIMNRVRYPFLLSSIQFAFASLGSFAYLRITNTTQMVPHHVSSLVMKIAVSYTFGFILTNSAFSLGIAIHSFISHRIALIVTTIACFYYSNGRLCGDYQVQ